MPRSKKMTKKKCLRVKCGDCKDGCRPVYCVGKNSISKNWCHCNLSKHIKCKSKKKLLSKAQKCQVPAEILHKKFPLIWRHLDNKTRKNLIKLAKKPVSKLNI